MSANHARRHQSGRTGVIDLRDHRARRARELCEIRDAIGELAVAYRIHAQPGVDVLIAQVEALEGLVRQVAPTVYDQRWIAWANQRAARSDHDPRSCVVCGTADPTVGSAS